MVGSVIRRRARLALGAAIAVLAAAAATGAANKVTALSRLEPGLWQLRDLDAPKAAQQSICVADPILLMQLRHRGAPCTRLVVADGERDAVVHYTCPASGYGQTALRVETPRLAQIDTQGIIENRPFALRAEARRVGPCQNAAGR
ncbi:MAG TPA: hypothetical protein VF631_09495 [Allosphingosinicella sp.]|jgi:hypothetical protein|uniref:DUF3617 domain-containing protein n=1 Tax=Allosphingosinicella sp. TaxID=2823234 RepID=UPI002F272765